LLSTGGVLVPDSNPLDLIRINLIDSVEESSAFAIRFKDWSDGSIFEGPCEPVDYYEYRFEVNEPVAA